MKEETYDGPILKEEDVAAFRKAGSDYIDFALSKLETPPGTKAIKMNLKIPPGAILNGYYMLSRPEKNNFKIQAREVLQEVSEIYMDTLSYVGPMKITGSMPAVNRCVTESMDKLDATHPYIASKYITGLSVEENVILEKKFQDVREAANKVLGIKTGLAK